MLDTRELAWAAGLFEGEGSIHPWKTLAQKNGKTYTYPRLKLTMTDEDSVRRFHSAVGIGRVFGPYKRPANRKPAWEWQATTFEQCQAVIAMLWFGLGTRRRERARTVLSTPTKEE